MNGPGVAFECLAQNGLHVWEDAYVLEVINPKTLEPAAEGEVGELVLTTLARRGMPILRYRTSDLTRILPGPCACGREHRRIDRILGRADDMLIIKGCNLYPLQVEQVLLSFAEVGENYLIVLENRDGMDQMKVQVEIREEYFVEDMRVLTGLQKQIAHRLRDEILLTPRVELVQANSLPKSEGKAVRVVDRRGQA
jgi:phenylacetate-CoA ligase